MAGDMKGLPRAADASRPLDTFDVLVLGAIEHLTHRLRRGDAVSAQGAYDIGRVISRLEALKAAFDARQRIADAVVEDD